MVVFDIRLLPWSVEGFYCRCVYTKTNRVSCDRVGCNSMGGITTLQHRRSIVPTPSHCAMAAYVAGLWQRWTWLRNVKPHVTSKVLIKFSSCKKRGNFNNLCGHDFFVDAASHYGEAVPRDTCRKSNCNCNRRMYMPLRVVTVAS